MEDRGFLTDQLRRVVEGETHDQMGIAESTYRDYRSRAKHRARRSIEDLILLAESDTIDSSEVFEPDTLARLIDALMMPEDGHLTPRWNFDGTDTEYRDRYQYQIGLYTRLDHTIRGYGDMLLKTHKPGEEMTGLIDTDE